MAGIDQILHMVGFSVAGEQFCVDILKVQEIIRMMDITKIPNAPEYVEGVINLRGRVIPVIDFRKRCNIYDGSEVENDQKRIVVVAIGSRTVGIVVDNVSQVLKINPSEVSSTPEVAKGFDSDFIRGVAKDGDKLVILLDMERLISQDELDRFEDAPDEVTE